MVKTKVEGVFIKKPENIDRALRYVRVFIRDVMREQHISHNNHEVVLDYTVSSVGTKKRAKIDYIHPRMEFADKLEEMVHHQEKYTASDVAEFCAQFFADEEKPDDLL